MSRLRLLPVGLLALVVAAFLLSRVSSAVQYPGVGRVDAGPVLVDWSVSPGVGQPGDSLKLRAVAYNSGLQPLYPVVVLRLPGSLSADVFDLPAGATFNLQSNEISWMPALSPGAMVELELALTVMAVDVVNPEQRVEALVRVAGEEQRGAATIWLGIPPLVGRTLTQNRVAVGQPVRLDAEILGPGPISQVWSLGDGRQLDIIDPVVSYAAPGEYRVVVQASNPVGSVRSESILTVVGDPVAGFAVDDDTPSVNQAVSFASLAGGQPPLRLTWDFGDGTTFAGASETTHTYARTGVYQVRLVVENDFGRSEAYWQVAVGAPPVADLAVNERGVVGQPLEGQAMGDASVTGYTWDMGDGRTEDGQVISHRYRLPGNYYVTLIARNEYGETRVGRWVTIDPGLTALFVPFVLMADAGQAANLSADVGGVAGLDPFVPSVDSEITLAPLTFPPNTPLAEQLYAYINAARQQFNLPALAFSAELSRSAQSHVEDKAAFPDDPHTGTDGTTAAERLLRAGYPAGYAGEATAWGFSDPREAVVFWMNSPSHQVLLLNRNATDVGVGYVEDYASTNIWHWTADFGTRLLAPDRPALRAQEPSPGMVALDSDILNFSWVWAAPLASDQRFVVYLVGDARMTPLGIVNQPVYGSRYVLSSDAVNAMAAEWEPGLLSLNRGWQVRLEDGRGSVIAESEVRPLILRRDAALAATPTVLPTPPLVVTETPTGPASTPTPTVPPTAVPPTLEPTPVIVTETPTPDPFAIVTETPEP